MEKNNKDVISTGSGNPVQTQPSKAKINIQTSTGSEELKSVKNYSIQGLTLVLETDSGLEYRWVTPKEVIQVPERFLSKQIKNLQRRRLISIT